MTGKKNIDELINQMQDASNRALREQAFEEIYKMYYGQVRFVCTKLCNSKEDAEEVINDTFFDLYKQAATLRSSTILALLRKIAARHSYRKYNNAKNDLENTVHADGLIEEIPEMDSDFLPEAYLANKEMQVELLRIINDLPPQQSKMIYLYFYAEINTEEIARLENCTASNVRKTLFNARNTIKSKLQPSTAVVPLGALLFAEEAAFAISYASFAGVLGVACATTKVTSATAITTYVATAIACLAAISATVAVIYFTMFQQNDVIYTPSLPITVAEVQAEATIIRIYSEVPPRTFPQYSETIIPVAEYCDNGEAEYEVQEYVPAYSPEPVPEPPAEPAIEPTVLQNEPPVVPPPDLIPEDEDEEPPPYQVEDDDYYEDEEPDDEVYDDVPLDIDRTIQILTTLSTATTPACINHIVSYYGFAIANQMRRATGEHFTFYVINEGSGDILIGVAQYENGANWRMKFTHFPDGYMPDDILDLFYWMNP